MYMDSFMAVSPKISFSNIVDSFIVRTGEAAAITKIVDYTNLVIRECQMRVLHGRDLTEIAVAADSTGNLSWEIPSRLRVIQTVRYGTQHIYPKMILPGRLLEGQTHFYYPSTSSYMFSGLLPYEEVQIAYYTWLPPLSYYPTPESKATLVSQELLSSDYETRPAYFDTATDAWMYLQSDGTTYGTSLSTEALMAAARAKSANWLILNWGSAITCGVLSQYYTSQGDATKSPQYYSQYQQWLNNLKLAATTESTGY